MQIPETEITEAFLRIYFTLKHHGDQVLTQLIQDLQTAKNGKLLWSEDIVELNKQIADIACQERLLAQLKQQAVVDPDIFIFQSNQLAEQRREAKLKKSRILRSEDDQTVQRTQELLDILEDGPDLLMTFDEALFSELVETITIQDNSTFSQRGRHGAVHLHTVPRRCVIPVLGKRAESESAPLPHRQVLEQKYGGPYSGGQPLCWSGSLSPDHIR